jgi:hypothetical protein
MRKQPTPRAFLASAALCTLVACGGGDREADPQTGGPAAAPVAVENPATLTGHIAFDGVAPPPRPIDMRDEPSCAERHEEGTDSQEIVVNDGRLKNVFVYISEGITDTHPTSGDEVLIDQEGCIYHPRVVGAQTRQTIVFRNSDGLLHNIKAVPSVNRGFNISQPNNMDTQRSFPSQEVMIPIECNVHGWMQAYIGVLDHPYFAVSAADGTFTIENLPPGTYTVETWHERYGTQTQQVTLGPDETGEVVFSYDASMAGRPVPMGPPLDPHVHAVAAVDGHAASHPR